MTKSVEKKFLYKVPILDSQSDQNSETVHFSSVQFVHACTAIPMGVGGGDESDYHR